MNADTWNKIKEKLGIALDALLVFTNKVLEKIRDWLNNARLHGERARLENEIRTSKRNIGEIVYRKVTTEKLTDLIKKLEIDGEFKSIAQKQDKLKDVDKRISAQNNGKKPVVKKNAPPNNRIEEAEKVSAN